jgi:hypothetical protein
MVSNYISVDLSQVATYSSDTYNHGFSKNLQKELNESLSNILLHDDPAAILIITIVWESSDIYWKPQFQKFIDALSNKFEKILLILNNFYKPFDMQFNHATEILYVDFFLYKVYDLLYTKKLSNVAHQWDPLEKNILFMTGKPYKINRTRLLYKLLNSPVAKYLSWSFFVDSSEESSVRNYLDDLTFQEQTAFLSTRQQIVDKYGGTQEGADGEKFDVKIYSDSLFQIISETDFDRPFSNAWITEKTWLSVANRRPFIIAGEFTTLTVLKQMGICTFENYMDIPNYDDPSKENFLCYAPYSGKTGFFECLQSQTAWKNFYQQVKDKSWPDHIELDQVTQLPLTIQQEIKNTYQKQIASWGEIRLDAIVANAVSFHNNIPKYVNNIAQDVEHNHQKFLDLAQHNQHKLEQFCQRHNLILDDVSKLFSIFL